MSLYTDHFDKLSLLKRILELETQIKRVSRFVVVGLSRNSPVSQRVLGFSSLRKINTYIDLSCDPWSNMGRMAAA